MANLTQLKQIYKSFQLDLAGNDEGRDKQQVRFKQKGDEQYEDEGTDKQPKPTAQGAKEATPKKKQRQMRKKLRKQQKEQEAQQKREQLGIDFGAAPAADQAIASRRPAAQRPSRGLVK